MASVTFPTNLGGSGQTISDDADPNTGLANGGHRLRFVPALQGTVDMAQYVYQYAAKIDQAADDADRAENARGYVEAYAGALKSNIETYYDKLATLKLDFGRGKYFADDGDLTETTSPADLLTVTRATPKWVEGPNGKLREVPPNVIARQWRNGEPQGALIEDSRTNLALWSEDFTQPSWQRRNLSVGLSSVESPLGDQAWLLTEGGGNENRQVRYFTEFVEGSTYTASCFLKAKERNFCRVQLSGQAFGLNLVAAVVDLSDGSLVSLEGSPLSYKIEPCVNGFYRVSVTQTAIETDNTTSRFEVVMLGPSASYTYSGDGVSSMYATGAQLEEASTSSSYIPTTDSPVTRAADSVSRTLGEEFNHNGFTVYGEFYSVGNNVIGNPRLFSLDSSGSDRVSLRVGTPTKRHVQIQIVNSDGPVLSSSMNLPSWPESGLVKIAYSVKNGVAVMGWNGQAATAAIEGRLPVTTTFSPVLSVEKYNSAFTKSFIIPQALTEAELIELTA